MYTVKIIEKLERTVTVEAENKEEARAIVERRYCNGDIVLDADDYQGDTDIIVED